MGRGCGFFGGGKWSSYGEYFRDKDKKTHRQFHASLQNRSRQQPCYASSSHSPELSRQGRFSPDGEEERDLPSVLNRTLQLVSPQDTSTPPPRKDNSLTFTTTPNNVGCAALCSSFSSSSSSSSFACPLDRIPGLHAAVSRSSSSPRDGDSRTGAGDEGGYGRTVVARRVRDILLSIHEGRLNLKQDNSKGNGSGGLCTPFSNRSLFKNCVFYIDGDTLGIDDVCFKKLLLFFGGRICMLFGKGCTHVIAENLALGNQRWRQLRDRGGERRKFAVVTVSWIFQCIDSGKLVPVGEFLPEALQVRSRYASCSIDSFYGRREKKSSFLEEGKKKTDYAEEVSPEQQDCNDCVILSEESPARHGGSRTREADEVQHRKESAVSHADGVGASDGSRKGRNFEEACGFLSKEVPAEADADGGRERLPGVVSSRNSVGGREGGLGCGSSSSSSSSSRLYGSCGGEECRAEGMRAFEEQVDFSLREDREPYTQEEQRQTKKRRTAGHNRTDEYKGEVPAPPLSTGQPSSPTPSTSSYSGAHVGASTELVSSPSSSSSFSSPSSATSSSQSFSPSPVCSFPLTSSFSAASSSSSVSAAVLSSSGNLRKSAVSASGRPSSTSSLVRLSPTAEGGQSSSSFPSSASSSCSPGTSASSASSPASLPATASFALSSSLSPTNKTFDKPSNPTSGPPKSKKPPERIVSAQDPSFVSTFFENSRLHFIGRWKVRCMDILASILRSEKEERRPSDTGPPLGQPPSRLSSASLWVPSRSEHFVLEDTSSLVGSLLPFLLPLPCTPPSSLDVAVSAEAAATDPGGRTRGGNVVVSSSRGGALERLLVLQQSRGQKESGRRAANLQSPSREDQAERERQHSRSVPNGGIEDKCHRDDIDSPMRWTIHVDFDAFFVAVALKKRPHLKDFPVAVSHSRGSKGRMGGSTSEVASCNYVARARGVYKGQWLGEAMVLCPDLIALPYDFEGIEEATQGLFECLLAVSRRILPVSCDEAYLQVLLYRVDHRPSRDSPSVLLSSSSSSSSAPTRSSLREAEGVSNKEVEEERTSGVDTEERKAQREGDGQVEGQDSKRREEEEDLCLGERRVNRGPVSREDEEEAARTEEELDLLEEAEELLLRLCVRLREKIFRTTGCWVSVGAGPNLLAAKLAGLRAKPNHGKLANSTCTPPHHPLPSSSSSLPSFSSSPSSSNSRCCLEAEGVCVVSLDEARLQLFMENLPVQKLPGVGPVVWNQVLRQGGMATCGDVMKRKWSSLRSLQQLLGRKRGSILWWLCHGEDPRSLPPFSFSSPSSSSSSGLVSSGPRRQASALSSCSSPSPLQLPPPPPPPPLPCPPPRLFSRSSAMSKQNNLFSPAAGRDRQASREKETSSSSSSTGHPHRERSDGVSFSSEKEDSVAERLEDSPRQQAHGGEEEARERGGEEAFRHASAFSSSGGEKRDAVRLRKDGEEATDLCRNKDRLVREEHMKGSQEKKRKEEKGKEEEEEEEEEEGELSLSKTGSAVGQEKGRKDSEDTRDILISKGGEEFLFSSSSSSSSLRLGPPATRGLTISVNWGIRLTEEKDVVNLLAQLAVEAEKRLRLQSVYATRVGLKIFHRREGVPLETEKFLGAGVCDALTAQRYCSDPLPDFFAEDSDLPLSHFPQSSENSGPPSSSASSSPCSASSSSSFSSSSSSSSGSVASLASPRHPDLSQTLPLPSPPSIAGARTQRDVRICRNGSSPSSFLSGDKKTSPVQQRVASQSRTEVERELLILWLGSLRGLCPVHDFRGFNVMLTHLLTEEEYRDLLAKARHRQQELQRQRNILTKFLSAAQKPSSSSPPVFREKNPSLSSSSSAENADSARVDLVEEDQDEDGVELLSYREMQKAKQGAQAKRPPSVPHPAVEEDQEEESPVKRKEEDERPKDTVGICSPEPESSCHSQTPGREACGALPRCSSSCSFLSPSSVSHFAPTPLSPRRTSSSPVNNSLPAGASTTALISGFSFSSSSSSSPTGTPPPRCRGRRPCPPRGEASRSGLGGVGGVGRCLRSSFGVSETRSSFSSQRKRNQTEDNNAEGGHVYCSSLQGVVSDQRRTSSSPDRGSEDSSSFSTPGTVRLRSSQGGLNSTTRATTPTATATPSSSSPPSYQREIHGPCFHPHVAMPGTVTSPTGGGSSRIALRRAGGDSETRGVAELKKKEKDVGVALPGGGRAESRGVGATSRGDSEDGVGEGAREKLACEELSPRGPKDKESGTPRRPGSPASFSERLGRLEEEVSDEGGGEGEERGSNCHEMASAASSLRPLAVGEEGAAVDAWPAHADVPWVVESQAEREDDHEVYRGEEQKEEEEEGWKGPSVFSGKRRRSEDLSLCGDEGEEGLVVVEEGQKKKKKEKPPNSEHCSPCAFLPGVRDSERVEVDLTGLQPTQPAAAPSPSQEELLFGQKKRRLEEEFASLFHQETPKPAVRFSGTRRFSPRSTREEEEQEESCRGRGRSLGKSRGPGVLSGTILSSVRPRSSASPLSFSSPNERARLSRAREKQRRGQTKGGEKRLGEWKLSSPRAQVVVDESRRQTLLPVDFFPLLFNEKEKKGGGDDAACKERSREGSADASDVCLLETPPRVVRKRGEEGRKHSSSSREVGGEWESSLEKRDRANGSTRTRPLPEGRSTRKEAEQTRRMKKTGRGSPLLRAFANRKTRGFSSSSSSSSLVSERRHRRRVFFREVICLLDDDEDKREEEAGEEEENAEREKEEHQEEGRRRRREEGEERLLYEEWKALQDSLGHRGESSIGGLGCCLRQGDWREDRSSESGALAREREGGENKKERRADKKNADLESRGSCEDSAVESRTEGGGGVGLEASDCEPRTGEDREQEPLVTAVSSTRQQEHSGDALAGETSQEEFSSSLLSGKCRSSCLSPDGLDHLGNRQHEEGEEKKKKKTDERKRRSQREQEKEEKEESDCVGRVKEDHSSACPLARGRQDAFRRGLDNERPPVWEGQEGRLSRVEKKEFHECSSLCLGTDKRLEDRERMRLPGARQEDDDLAEKSTAEKKKKEERKEKRKKRGDIASRSAMKRVMEDNIVGGYGQLYLREALQQLKEAWTILQMEEMREGGCLGTRIGIQVSMLAKRLLRLAMLHGALAAAVAVSMPLEGEEGEGAREQEQEEGKKVEEEKDNREDERDQESKDDDRVDVAMRSGRRRCVGLVKAKGSGRESEREDERKEEGRDEKKKTREKRKEEWRPSCAEKVANEPHPQILALSGPSRSSSSNQRTDRKEASHAPHEEEEEQRFTSLVTSSLFPFLFSSSSCWSSQPPRPGTAIAMTCNASSSSSFSSSEVPWRWAFLLGFRNLVEVAFWWSFDLPRDQGEDKKTLQEKEPRSFTRKKRDQTFFPSSSVTTQNYSNLKTGSAGSFSSPSRKGRSRGSGTRENHLFFLLLLRSLARSLTDCKRLAEIASEAAGAARAVEEICLSFSSSFSVEEEEEEEASKKKVSCCFSLQQALLGFLGRGGGGSGGPRSVAFGGISGQRGKSEEESASPRQEERQTDREDTEECRAGDDGRESGRSSCRARRKGGGSACETREEEEEGERGQVVGGGKIEEAGRKKEKKEEEEESERTEEGHEGRRKTTREEEEETGQDDGGSGGEITASTRDQEEEEEMTLKAEASRELEGLGKVLNTYIRSYFS